MKCFYFYVYVEIDPKNISTNYQKTHLIRLKIQIDGIFLQILTNICIDSPVWQLLLRAPAVPVVP